jgi:hypothetical protein
MVLLKFFGFNSHYFTLFQSLCKGNMLVFFYNHEFLKEYWSLCLLPVTSGRKCIFSMNYLLAHATNSQPRDQLILLAVRK